MTDPFGFHPSPLLRKDTTLSFDGIEQDKLARMAGLVGIADMMHRSERTTMDTTPAAGATTSPVLNFPLPSALRPDVRPPAAFGTQPFYGFAQPYDPSGINENDNANPNVNAGLGIGLPLRPLRVPDRSFTSSNPNSSVSTTTTPSSSGFFGYTQPPPHIYPTHSSSSTSSDQLYTPTSAGYSQSQSTYLTPPSGPDGQTTSLPSINLPGVTSLFPQPTQGQIQLPPPTTVEPKTFSHWSGRVRGSTSSLSLRDSKYSVSPLSAAPLSISRSTSVESEAYTRPNPNDFPPHHHHPLTTGLPMPKMETYDAATMMVYGGGGGGGRGAPVDLANMVREGDMCYTDEAEVKQTPYIKRRCYNCDHRSPPSWRKSLLAPGKILCNKCGIFERTHNRPRPPQGDDLKLRRQMSPPSEISMSVSVSTSNSTSASAPASAYSSPTSQYSRAPTTTPLSATFPSPAHLPPIQLPSVRTTFWATATATQNETQNTNGPTTTALQSPPPGYGYTHSHTRGGGQSPPPAVVGYAPYPRPGSLKRSR